MQYLHEIGITKFIHPPMGGIGRFDGIVKDMISRSHYSTIENHSFCSFENTMDHMLIAKTISFIETNGELPFHVEEKAFKF